MFRWIINNCECYRGIIKYQRYCAGLDVIGYEVRKWYVLM